jgi:hypothetical protein
MHRLENQSNFLSYFECDFKQQGVEGSKIINTGSHSSRVQSAVPTRYSMAPAGSMMSKHIYGNASILGESPWFDDASLLIPG